MQRTPKEMDRKSVLTKQLFFRTLYIPHIRGLRNLSLPLQLLAGIMVTLYRTKYHIFYIVSLPLGKSSYRLMFLIGTSKRVIGGGVKVD